MPAEGGLLPLFSGRDFRHIPLHWQLGPYIYHFAVIEKGSLFRNSRNAVPPNSRFFALAVSTTGADMPSGKTSPFRTAERAVAALSCLLRHAPAR